MPIPVGLNVWSRLVEDTFPLRVVARHADWWNYNFHGREDYVHKQEVLKQHCREVGREYAVIRHVVRVGILIAETEREVERLKAQPHVRPMEAGDLVGTPARVTEMLLQAIAAGAHRLTVHFADAPRPHGTSLFAATVLPHLLGA